jgi:hypothetical protein
MTCDVICISLDGTELAMNVLIITQVAGEFCANACFHEFSSSGKNFQDTGKQSLMMVRGYMKSKQ